MKNIINLFFYSSLLILIITSFEVLIHYSASIEVLKNSKNTLTVFTNFSAEFTILSAIAFILFFDQTINKQKLVTKKLSVISLAVFFILLHFIALRFSLLLVYLFLFAYLVYYFVHRKQITLMILMISFIILIPIIFYRFIESFQAKVDNTYQDMKVLIQDKNPNDYSISQRGVALKCSIAAIKKNIWFGVSPADAESTMQTEYTQGPYLLTPENRIFVHNQFFFFALSFGLPITLIIIGLLLYFSCVVIKGNQILLFIIPSFFIYWMIENGLEKQITATALLFFVFLLNQNSSNGNKKNIIS